MTCSDFCTAAKCEELELKISSLEAVVNNLLETVNNHIYNDNIYFAHNWYPTLETKLSFVQNQLEVAVNFDDVVSSDWVDLSELLISSFAININELGNNLYEFEVTINDAIDTAQFTFAEPQIDFETYQIEDNVIGWSLIYNEFQDQGQFEIILPEVEPTETTEHVVSNLRINGIHQGDYLYLTVADGESQDTATIYLNTETNIFGGGGGDEHIPSNLAINGIYENDYLYISVADGESADTTEIYMNFEQKIDNCCDEILGTISNLENVVINEVNGARIDINNNIQEVENYVTLDVTAQVNSKYKCEFPLDENSNTIPTYAQSNVEAVDITEAKGLAAIHAYLQVITTNLDAIHNDVCKAVDPISEINYSDLYKFCNNSDIKREDYGSDEFGEQQYQEAITAYLNDLLINSKYGYLINNIQGETLINAPNNWITPILSDFALIQSRINNTAICDIELEVVENPEVVAIVASDKALDRAQGKLLTLHLVTEDNYPTRGKNSTYWQWQLPEAFDLYAWDDDFLDLRWQRGNLYCEMFFEDIKDPVSGWYKDEESANAWFDRVLLLTTASERNRKYHYQQSPTRTITEQTVRPYRAFVSQVNAQGRSECLTKYQPVLNNE